MFGAEQSFGLCMGAGVDQCAGSEAETGVPVQLGYCCSKVNEGASAKLDKQLSSVKVIRTQISTLWCSTDQKKRGRVGATGHHVHVRSTLSHDDLGSAISTHRSFGVLL